MCHTKTVDKMDHEPFERLSVEHEGCLEASGMYSKSALCSGRLCWESSRVLAGKALDSVESIADMPRFRLDPGSGRDQ